MIFPVQLGEKWGFIDEELNVVVPPAFDAANPIMDGFAAFRQGGRWGFVDLLGTVVCPPTFAATGYFDGGICWVRDETGCAVVDRDFKERYRLAEGKPAWCHDGVLMVRTDDATYSYLEADGRVFLRGNYVCQNFSEGLLAFQAEVPGTFGFMNLRGEWAIEPKFESTGDFSEGLAAVAVTKKGAQAVGFIGRDGELRLPFHFDTILPLARFQSGRAIVWQESKRRELVGYIDPRGEFAIEPQFDEGCPFRGGVAAVARKKKWGLVDVDGRWICPPKFEFFGDHVDRPLIWARCGKTIGYYSRDGELRLESG